MVSGLMAPDWTWPPMMCPSPQTPMITRPSPRKVKSAYTGVRRVECT